MEVTGNPVQTAAVFEDVVGNPKVKPDEDEDVVAADPKVRGAVAFAAAVTGTPNKPPNTTVEEDGAVCAREPKSKRRLPGDVTSAVVVVTEEESGEAKGVSELAVVLEAPKSRLVAVVEPEDTVADVFGELIDMFGPKNEVVGATDAEGAKIEGAATDENRPEKEGSGAEVEVVPSVNVDVTLGTVNVVETLGDELCPNSQPEGCVF